MKLTSIVLSVTVLLIALIAYIQTNHYKTLYMYINRDTVDGMAISLILFCLGLAIGNLIGQVFFS